ncbi:MAG: hypothetical protein ACTSU5_15455 [Promethearchaeota archaeon]
MDSGSSPNTNSKFWKFPPETPEQALVAEITFLVVVVVAVGVFGRLAATSWHYTLALTLVFAVNLGVRFWLVNERGDWAFYLLGVVGGGGNDLMSMLNGVYSYTSVPMIPALRGLMPLWMILFWGQVFLLFRKVFHLRWFRGSPFARDGPLLWGWVDGRLAFDVALVVVLRAVIYKTYALPYWVPAAAYGIGVLARLVAFPLRRNEWLIVAVLPYAFCFEGLMVSFGLYVYVNPVFLGMPLWLFLWWVVLVPCLVKELFDRLEYLLEQSGFPSR